MTGAAADIAPGDMAAFAPFRTDDALMGFIGTVELAASESAITMRVDCAAQAANPQGILHGGVLSTLCDVGMYEVAKRSFGADCVTTAQEMKFLRAAARDQILTVISSLIKPGRRQAVCQASVHQGDRLIAFSTGQFTCL